MEKSVKIVTRENVGTGWCTFTRLVLENGDEVMVSSRRDEDWDGQNILVARPSGNPYRYRGGDEIFKA
uniref:Uncharacterized protein n=1 Tax=viral metagenome TaxID=1070528 RepID=A0A6M3KHH5_9ZZZZ